MKEREREDEYDRETNVRIGQEERQKKRTGRRR